MISTQLFGGVLLRRESTVLTGPPVQRHRVALLALLAATWPQTVARDRAMALLWPDRDLPQARRLLNLAVHVLRRALGEGTIVSVGDALLFEPSGVSCDVQRFRAALRSGEADQVTRTYGGVFLDGFHLPDSPEFDAWLSQTRAEFARACVNALESLRDRQREGGDHLGVSESCRRLVALDPYSSDRTISLMEALVEVGDRAAALRAGQEHVRRMRQELDLEAETAVTSLIERLRSPAVRQERPLESVPTQSTSRHTPLVAVSPFREVESEAADDHELHAELYDRVLSRLVGSRLLRVAATAVHALRLTGTRSSSMLGADALVETGLRSEGGSLHVSVRVVDAATGVFLRAERLERPATALDPLADEIAQVVLSSVVRSSTAASRPDPADPESEEAATLCAKGLHFAAKREVSALRKAIRYFEQARTLAPGFTPAYTGLANAFAVLGFYDLLPPREAFARAKHEARMAMSLDPSKADSHVSLGYVTKYFDWRWEAAEREFRDAVRLDPNNSLAHQWFGNYLALRGRGPESIESMRRAVRLAPTSALANAAHGWAHYFAGDYHRTIDHCLESLELDPSFPVAHLWLGQAYEELGEHEKALAALEAAVPASSHAAAFRAAHAHALARAGAREEAEELLVQLLSERRTRYVPAYELAKLHLALGMRAGTIRWLEQAIHERSHSIGFLRVDPQLAPLRDDPAFLEMVTRVGLL